MTAKTITARDLLYEFLDLHGLTPDLAEWNEESLSINPPRLIRFRRLVALFRAFDIAWNPGSFVDGTFIQADQLRYAALLMTIEAALPEQMWKYDRLRGHLFLPGSFEYLLHYRELVDRVLSCGMDVASGPYLYVYLKTAELNRLIRGNVASIDDVLIALIDPEGKEISLDRLIREYGYPDVDLRRIDLDHY